METPRGPAHRVGGCGEDGPQAPRRPPPAGAKLQVPPHGPVTQGGQRLRAWGAPAGPCPRTRTSAGSPLCAEVRAAAPGPCRGPCVILTLSPHWDVDEDTGWTRGLAGFAVPGGRWARTQACGPQPAPQPAPVGPLSAGDTQGLRVSGSPPSGSSRSRQSGAGGGVRAELQALRLILTVAGNKEARGHPRPTPCWTLAFRTRRRPG